jgi:hypothetical protein
MDDLDLDVQLAQMATAAMPRDDPDRPALLDSLGKLFGNRFQQTNSITDLDWAVTYARLAVEATPPAHPDRGSHLNCYAVWLCMRYEKTELTDDLDLAIKILHQAVEAMPIGHTDRLKALANLGSSLGRRFERTKTSADLDHAIEFTKTAVKAMPHNDRTRPGLLANLGTYIEIRYGQTGLMDDLDYSINILRTVVDDATRRRLPDRAGPLNNLSIALGRRFDRTDSIDDLDNAIKFASMAVDATLPGSPNRAGNLSNYGVWLSRRFERFGWIEDLNNAIDVSNKAVEATKHGHFRAGMLTNLGTRLGSRFERTGSMDDLNRSVQLTNMAVEATPQDHIERPIRLSNLGNRLGSRFEQTGSIDDLNRAIEVTSMAVEATPQGDPDRSTRLSNLGIWFRRRFERTRSEDDINSAIKAGSMAVDISPGRAGHLNGLAISLGRRSELTDSMDDLNRAIEIMDGATNTISQDHPVYVALLNTLGNRLGRRSERNNSMTDLNRAIKVIGMAVEAEPRGHVGRAGLLENLGLWLTKRYERNGSTDDLNRALSSFKEGWECDGAPPSVRISLAQKAADILISRSDWDESSKLLRSATGLLPIVSPRTLQNPDRQHMLARFAGMASMAAAATLNAGKGAHLALETLELGRGVIARHLMETRTDITELHEQYPEQAQKFEALRDELDAPEILSELSPSDNPALSAESRLRRRREADQQFKELVDEIQGLTGFGNFLRPPTESQLIAQASSGPIIVVNLSRLRCDAFLVDSQHIWPKRLEVLTLESVEEHARSIGSDRRLRAELPTMLAWLWDVVASPCLKELGFTQPHPGGKWPRVWWIPTGSLSLLPLHAAGHHGDGLRETVLDRVISSYSSSIMALMYGRQRNFDSTSRQDLRRVLIVAMEETPGTSRLPFAGQELEEVAAICLKAGLNPAQPSRNCRGEVLKDIQTCKLFHFAGHGWSNPREPTQSRLLLEDWERDPLTVADLRDNWCHESEPFLAYLSACSTGKNDGEGLADEAIHLISACQLAGFRHIIGTLWEVGDEHALHAARKIYGTMCDELWMDDAAALGLHDAVTLLRNKTGRMADCDDGQVIADIDDEVEKEEKKNTETGNNRGVRDYPVREEGEPFIWAAYVHFGP